MRFRQKGKGNDKKKYPDKVQALLDNDPAFHPVPKYNRTYAFIQNRHYAQY
jgi:hypothetical protein